jgi:hypothetical protein
MVWCTNVAFSVYSSRYGIVPRAHIRTAATYSAAADIQDCEEVRALLADIYERRYQKIRNGLASAKDSEAIKMNNLTRMEISSIRPFFVESMNAFFVLNDALDRAFDGGPD